MGVGGHAATSWVTPPVKDWYKENPHGQNEATPAYNDAIFDHIRSKALTDRPLIVILAANWIFYLEKEADRDAFADALKTQIANLRSIGCKVILLRQFPYYSDHVPRSLALKLNFGLEQFDIGMKKKSYLRQRQPQDEIFESLSEQFAGLWFLDPTSRFLGDDNKMMVVSEEGYPLYKDHGHVSTEGALRISESLASLLGEILKNRKQLASERSEQ